MLLAAESRRWWASIEPMPLDAQRRIGLAPPLEVAADAPDFYCASCGPLPFYVDGSMEDHKPDCPVAACLGALFGGVDVGDYAEDVSPWTKMHGAD